MQSSWLGILAFLVNDIFRNLGFGMDISALMKNKPASSGNGCLDFQLLISCIVWDEVFKSVKYYAGKTGISVWF